VAIVSRFGAAPGRLEHPGFGALLTGEFRDDVWDDLPFLRHAMPAGSRFLRTPVGKVAVLVPPPLVRDGPAPETRAAPHLGEVEHLGIAAQKLSLSGDLHQLLDLVGIFHVEARLGRLLPAIRNRSDEGVADRLVLALESLLGEQNLVRPRPRERLRDPAR